MHLKLLGFATVLILHVSAPVAAQEQLIPDCEGGNVRSCFTAANNYANGLGVAKDESRAAQLYEKACDLGHANGCHKAGLNYANGQGVKKDESRAAQLYEKACDSGHAKGCNAANFKFPAYYAKDLLYSDTEFSVYSPDYPGDVWKGEFCFEKTYPHGKMRTMNGLVVLLNISAEEKVTKEWMWNTFRPKVINNVIPKYCPNAYKFYADFFVNGLAIRIDQKVYDEYEADFPSAFRVDDAVMPALKFARTGYIDWMFEQKDEVGQTQEIRASFIMQKEGFLNTYFLVPEHMPGGISWASQAGFEKHNFSFETFAMGTYYQSSSGIFNFSDPSKSEYSLQDYIREGRDQGASVVNRKLSKAFDDELWQLFLKAATSDSGGSNQAMCGGANMYACVQDVPIILIP